MDFVLLVLWYVGTHLSSPCIAASFIDNSGAWGVPRLCLVLLEECVYRIIAILPPSLRFGHDEIGWKGEVRPVWELLIKHVCMTEFFSLSLPRWVTANLRDDGKFGINGTNWSTLFSVIYWSLWRRRKKMSIDHEYVEKHIDLTANGVADSLVIALRGHDPGDICRVSELSELHGLLIDDSHRATRVG
ncbi:hypothetical protein V6N13_008138 [Hibiscus sabdariffa]